MHKIKYFPENLEKILDFTSKFRYERVTLITGIVIWPYEKASYGLYGQLECVLE